MRYYYQYYTQALSQGNKQNNVGKSFWFKTVNIGYSKSVIFCLLREPQLTIRITYYLTSFLSVFLNVGT